MTETLRSRSRQPLFDEAADRLGLDPTLREFLSFPEHVHHATLTVRMDDGSCAILRSHRIHYSSARGPVMGALRWHPDVSEDSTRAEAAATSWQAALLDLPHGGAAGAIHVDPKELSPYEKERVAREFVARYFRVMGGGRDVITAGTNVTPQILGWIAATVEDLEGPAGLGAVAGKPIALGGTMVPAEASARSAVLVAGECLRARGADPSRSSYGVIGFGALGRRVADLHAQLLGGSLRVVGDSRATIRRSAGIDPAEVIRHKLTTGQLGGFADAESRSAREGSLDDVDVLYLAATSHLVGEESAQLVRARVLCELCPNSVDRPADILLHGQGKTVIPSLLATGGRLIAAHCESGTGTGQGVLTTHDVEARIADGVSKALQSAASVGNTEGCSLRTAAWMVGIERVAEAARARGWC